jgi:hypothetical protein
MAIPMNSLARISALFEHEVELIVDAKLKARIRELSVVPYLVERSWDYGTPGQQFSCWIVVEHRESNTGVAFCDVGFGPAYPWVWIRVGSLLRNKP